MVKVISVHHFLSQDVASIPNPLASAIAGQSTLLIATDNLHVEVRDLKKAGQISHTFPTIDQVSRLVHSPVGNYIATLEGRPGEKGASVRIYCNWANPKVETASVRPRIASRVTPSLRSDQPGLDNMLDLIEFPHRDSPVQIAVCPSTGNFMVAAVNVLVIYKYSLKTQEMSKTKFIDFEDCIHIFHNFLPTEISLVEDVVGCLNTTEVHVFKVKLVDCNDEKNLRSVSVYSFSSESESSLDPWTGKPRRNSNVSDNTTDSDQKPGMAYKNVTLAREEGSETSEIHHIPGYVGNVRRHPNHIFLPDGLSAKNKIVLADVEKANRDFLSHSSPKIMDQIIGPKAAPPLVTNGSGHSGLNAEVIVKLVPTAATSDQDSMVEAEAVTLVHCKLLKSEEDRNQFKNLCLVPVFWREFRVRKSNHHDSRSPMSPHGLAVSQIHPLQSNFHPHLMSMTMCFTSNNEGYIYHLPGHIRKPGRGLGVQRVAVCPFTSPVGKITLESPTILHAITQTGLETYTLCTSFCTVTEAETMDNRTKACPESELPVCLVGLRPFLGVKNVVSSNTHLVLLSCSDENLSEAEAASEARPKWTLYNLALPTPLALYKNMLELADMSRTLNPQGYAELICEAHIVLRTACHQLAWQMATTKDNHGIDAQLQTTRESYHASCQLLGNYYALNAEARAEAEFALPYYRMSGKPILVLLKTARDLWLNEGPKGSQLTPGLIHYITQIILNPIEGEDIMEAKLADLIIDLLGQYAPNTLALLVLKSPNFRQFKSSKILSHINELLKNDAVESFVPEPIHVLAFVVLSVEQTDGDLEKCRTFLQLLQPGKLSEVALEHHEFLIEATGTDQSLSGMASLLRDAVPGTFVEILVSLIKSDVYSLQMVLRLLIGSLVSSSSTAENRANDTALLQLFLEAYFIDVIESSSDLGEEQTAILLDGDQLQALHTLVRSYLTSLSVPVRFEEKNIDCNMFGNRHLYLDLLPPFKSSTNVKDLLLNADSPEFWCQNSLLKLQSLLCSNLCRGASCKSIVQGYLDIKQDTIGFLSLRILCLDDPKSSVPLLVDSHPEVLLPFAKENKADLDIWKLMLKCLQDELSTKSTEDPKHEAWYSAMQEILDHLAKTLILDTFLDVLPGPQNNEDFQGYIQLCRKNQQAHQIQNLIVNTGHKLLSTLTF